KMHRLANLRRKLIVTLVSSLSIILALGVLLQQFTAGVVVEVAGVARSDAPVREYEQSLQRYFSRNPVERLRCKIDQEAMTNFINSEYPETESVRSEGYESLAASRFEVELRTPVVSWQVDDKVYYVDQYGVSFEKNMHAQPSVKIIDNSGVNYTSGT